MESSDYSQAQVYETSMGRANMHSFLLRKFMGRPVLLRPGSKHLPALDMLSAVAATVGREVHVFVSPAAVPPTDEGPSASLQTDEEPDEFYEFTVEDYARTQGYRKQDIFLKTRKIRDEEDAAKQARMTKAVIRVQFPDSYVLEAVFLPSDPLTLLVELLQKVILHPNSAFYLYTTPPKQRIKDLQQSMYTAGFTPGALVYFSYDLLKGQEVGQGPYLRPEISALRDLHLIESPVPQQEPETLVESVTSVTASVSDQKRDAKRPSGKPKWFKQR
ncbi:unnamed protein product [Calypogeia fissa]